MKDQQNKKGKDLNGRREPLSPEAAAAADQTPGVAGPPLDSPGGDVPHTTEVSSDAPADPESAGSGTEQAGPADAVVITPASADVQRERPKDKLDKSVSRAGAKGGKVSGGGRGTPPGGPTTAAAGGGSGGKGVAALALLVALAALGLSGWQWYQAQAPQVVDQTAEDGRLDQLAEGQAASQARVDELSRRVQGLPDADEVQHLQRLTGDLQRSQQALGQRLEALQGEAQADWKLAEAEYMLRLASLRLLAAQDVRSAKELLRAADEILRDQPDSGVFAVREQMAQVQAELETLPEIDRPGLYLRLAALHEQVNRIVALPVPVFDPDEVSVEEEFEERMARRTRAERVLMRLERYVRVDFQRGKVVTPLLDEAEMQRIRRTLQLTLEQAQWAALRGESEVYRASLERADDMLRQFFELDNPQVRALQGQLALLAEQQVSLQTPDLAPLQRSLAAYVQTLRSGPANATGSAPVEAGDE